MATGCGAGGSSSTRTERVPPDRLALTLDGAGAGALRIDLECAVADRAACSAVIAALLDVQSDDECAPAADPADASILVSGTIDGARVESVVTRRTTCQGRAYDRIVRGLGR